MPLQTFYNLAHEKQMEIINICFSEFASSDFESASLARIIKDIGVAKGSFYRYFQDKKDVYEYLFEISRKEIIQAYEDAFSDTTKSFYECWKYYIELVLELEVKYPDLMRFQLKTSYDHSSYVRVNNGEKKLNEKLNTFCKLLQRYQAKGEIRKDVPLTILALVMSYTQYGIFSYLMLKSKTAGDTTKKELNDFMEIIKGGFNIFEGGN